MNEREYRITNAKVAKFRRALAEFAAQQHSSIHPRLLKGQEDALRSQLSELEAELKQFESLWETKQAWAACGPGLRSC
jgi:hypothetical protein